MIKALAGGLGLMITRYGEVVCFTGYFSERKSDFLEATIERESVKTIVDHLAENKEGSGFLIGQLKLAVKTIRGLKAVSVLFPFQDREPIYLRYPQFKMELLRRSRDFQKKKSAKEVKK